MVAAATEAHPLSADERATLDKLLARASADKGPGTRIGEPYVALINLSVPRRGDKDRLTDLVFAGETVYLTDEEARSFQRHGVRDGRQVEVLRKLSGPDGSAEEAPRLLPRHVSGRLFRPTTPPPGSDAPRPDPEGSSRIQVLDDGRAPEGAEPAKPDSAELADHLRETVQADALDLPPRRARTRHGNPVSAMGTIAGTITPEAAAGLRCPRCWFTGALFEPYAALTFRCTRCEWPFLLAAPSLSAAPAFPATTVAVANPYATPIAAAIAANGATITNVSVSAVTAGTTAGTYLIPAGGTISATYTVATPTWTWALPVTSASTLAGGTALTFAPTGTNVAFAIGQVLIIDPAGTSDVVTVNGAPTATSVPVTALNASHGSGKSVAVAQLTPALSGVENVPQTAY